MFGRIFTTHLLVGTGLALVLGAGSAAEGPVAEPVTEGSRVGSVTEDPVAELVRIDGKERTAVKGNDQVVRSGDAPPPLREGDRVSVPAGGIAVVEYHDGCRDTVEGGAKTIYVLHL